MNQQTHEGQRKNIGGEPMSLSTAEKIDRALYLLDEAAKEKKEELGRLIDEKYSNIKNIMSQTTDSYKETLERTKQNLTEAMASGEARVKEMAAGFDSKVHDDPWPYLIITSIICLVSGFIIGGIKRTGVR